MKRKLAISLAIALLFMLGVETVAVASSQGSRGSTIVSTQDDDCKGADKKGENC